MDEPAAVWFGADDEPTPPGMAETWHWAAPILEEAERLMGRPGARLGAVDREAPDIQAVRMTTRTPNAAATEGVLVTTGFRSLIPEPRLLLVMVTHELARFLPGNAPDPPAFDQRVQSLGDGLRRLGAEEVADALAWASHHLPGEMVRWVATAGERKRTVLPAELACDRRAIEATGLGRELIVALMRLDGWLNNHGPGPWLFNNILNDHPLAARVAAIRDCCIQRGLGDPLDPPISPRELQPGGYGLTGPAVVTAVHRLSHRARAASRIGGHDDPAREPWTYTTELPDWVTPDVFGEFAKTGKIAPDGGVLRREPWIERIAAGLKSSTDLMVPAAVAWGDVDALDRNADPGGDGRAVSVARKSSLHRCSFTPTGSTPSRGRRRTAFRTTPRSRGCSTSWPGIRASSMDGSTQSGSPHSSTATSRSDAFTATAGTTSAVT